MTERKTVSTICSASFLVRSETRETSSTRSALVMMSSTKEDADGRSLPPASFGVTASA
jgi:hypothetical protein